MSMRLVADIGGTNSRFAISDDRHPRLTQQRRLLNRDHADIVAVITAYLNDLEGPAPATACLAVAAPPAADAVELVNIDWTFSKRSLAAHFGFNALRVLNDFEAVALALPHLAPTELIALNGSAIGPGNLCAMGPGTGLGGAALIRNSQGQHAVACEPGSAGLSPVTDLEFEVFRLVTAELGNVYAESLLSGPGLERLYRIVTTLTAQAPQALSAAQISARARDHSDPGCVQALSLFCDLLGSTVGDFVLHHGAWSGAFLAGGIVADITDFLRDSNFLQRFQHKGKMSKLLAQVPLCIISAEQPGLVGAMHAALH